ncbi:putative pathogenesis-related protein [Lachnellula occidentalis]|uniref:Putative pathogenesis-related protein n=1 Tax=Lachnellula occidentalis TaxID=215460 RepID=A0A8H8RD61_9HELO|nr:putative pathogenesis-related protein [Lachnellula occidentalis]
MRTATMITLFSAGLTVATPLHQLFHNHAKKALVTDMVTDVVTVYVTGTAQVSTPAAEPTSVEAVFAEVSPTSVAVAATSAAVSSTPVAVVTPPKMEHVHTHPVSIVVPASSSAASSSTTSSAVEVSIPIATTSAAPTTVVSSTSVAAPSSVVTPSSVVPVVASVASSSSAAPASSPTDYASTAVFQHNQHRSNHSASDVAWNTTLAGFAATSAAKCIFKHDNVGYGQNIAAWGASNGVPSTTNAVSNAITEAWYNGEVGDFPFGVASVPLDSEGLYNGKDILHFSQVVWKGSESVGCASHECGPNTVLGSANYNSVYTVCNYYPAGNVGGEYITDVGVATGAIAEMFAPISV